MAGRSYLSQIHWLAKPGLQSKCVWPQNSCSDPLYWLSRDTTQFGILNDKLLIMAWNFPQSDACKWVWVLSCNFFKWKMRSPLFSDRENLTNSQVRQMSVLGSFCKFPISDLLSAPAAWGTHIPNIKLCSALVPQTSNSNTNSHSEQVENLSTFLLWIPQHLTINSVHFIPSNPEASTDHSDQFFLICSAVEL